jgi:undecaprenyl-phosphate 4-deoxy-4-formamido-L-arabinose transferase
MKSLSIVIPCYNCSKSIEILLDEIESALEPDHLNWEVILVNDGSGDDTWPVIKALVDASPRIRGINLTRNFGQHNALCAGILASTGEYIITMDDDLQHPPAEIPHLMAEADRGFDLVYGVPAHEQHHWFRNIASVSTKYVLEKTLKVSLASDTSAFRIFSRQLLPGFENCAGPFVDVDAILAWGTQNIGTLNVAHRKRRHGRSNYSLSALISHTLKMIVSYSQIPLRISSMIGLVFLIFGALLLLYVMTSYLLYGSVVQGFTFIAVIVLIFSGAQLFAIGVLGEYIGRLNHRSMGQPIFMVRETAGPSGAAMPPSSTAGGAGPRITGNGH